jgi:CDP-glycerol glycerophosphotransferase (TagB/SpsB family)
LARPERQFADDKPVIVYTPHWQKQRSSWWAWGREIVRMLAAQDRYNVIVAPHQRLGEKDPEVRDTLGAVAHLPHVHVDLDSFAMVDGSYMAAADIYLGDTSSQIVEYLIRPRPCVFLDPQAIDWRATDDHEFWACGEVVTDLDALLAALEGAIVRHPEYVDVQRVFADRALGDTGPQASRWAAVLAAIGAQKPRLSIPRAGELVGR